MRPTDRADIWPTQWREIDGQKDHIRGRTGGRASALQMRIGYRYAALEMSENYYSRVYKQNKTKYYNVVG